MFIVYSLLNQKEAQYAYDGVRNWFKNNPDKKVCRTEYFSVRCDHIKEDILSQSEKEVLLQENPQNKCFNASLPNYKTTANKKTKKNSIKKAPNKSIKKGANKKEK